MFKLGEAAVTRDMFLIWSRSVKSSSSLRLDLSELLPFIADVVDDVFYRDKSAMEIEYWMAKEAVYL